MLLPETECPPINIADSLSQEEIHAAIDGLTGADFKRARRWASRRASNLPGWAGDDLLSEAMCKLLAGERVWPRNVQPLIVLAGVVKSISSNVRKGAASGAIDHNVRVDVDIADEEFDHTQHGVDSIDNRTPEASVEAKSELIALSNLLKGDDHVELVAMAWMDNLRGKEAAEAAGLDEKTYDAARKRLMRKLDEHRTNGRST